MAFANWCCAKLPPPRSLTRVPSCARLLTSRQPRLSTWSAVLTNRVRLRSYKQERLRRNGRQSSILHRGDQEGIIESANRKNLEELRAGHEDLPPGPMMSALRAVGTNELVLVTPQSVSIEGAPKPTVCLSFEEVGVVFVDMPSVIKGRGLLPLVRRNRATKRPEYETQLGRPAESCCYCYSDQADESCRRCSALGKDLMRCCYSPCRHVPGLFSPANRWSR